MRARFIGAAAGLLLLAASSAGAQGSAAATCPAGTTETTRATQDACQVAVDLFQVMAPQLGLAITGGNATLGQGGTLGGPGHFIIGLRGNVFNGTVPQVQNLTLSTTGRVQRGQGGIPSVPTEGQLLGMPAIEASVGVFRGLPLGVTNVGGVDLLVSASYVPNVNTDALDVEVDSPLKLGFGARLGLLQESLVLPGISVTWLRRDLPTMTITGRTDRGDEVVVRDLDLNTTAWRVVASKSFLMYGIAAGVGQDRYDASTTIEATVQSPIPLTGPYTLAPVSLDQDVTRTNMFVDLSLNLPFAKLVLEVGQVSGGSISTYNAFDGKAADASRIYGSAGLRVGF